MRLRTTRQRRARNPQHDPRRVAGHEISVTRPLGRNSPSTLQPLGASVVAQLAGRYAHPKRPVGIPGQIHAPLAGRAAFGVGANRHATPARVSVRALAAGAVDIRLAGRHGLTLAGGHTGAQGAITAQPPTMRPGRTRIGGRHVTKGSTTLAVARIQARHSGPAALVERPTPRAGHSPPLGRDAAALSGQVDRRANFVWPARGTGQRITPVHAESACPQRRAGRICRTALRVLSARRHTPTAHAEPIAAGAVPLAWRPGLAGAHRQTVTAPAHRQAPRVGRAGIIATRPTSSGKTQPRFAVARQTARLVCARLARGLAKRHWQIKGIAPKSRTARHSVCTGGDAPSAATDRSGGTPVHTPRKATAGHAPEPVGTGLRIVIARRADRSRRWAAVGTGRERQTQLARRAHAPWALYETPTPHTAPRAARPIDLAASLNRGSHWAAPKTDAPIRERFVAVRGQRAVIILDAARKAEIAVGETSATRLRRTGALVGAVTAALTGCTETGRTVRVAAARPPLSLRSGNSAGGAAHVGDTGRPLRAAQTALARTRLRLTAAAPALSVSHATIAGTERAPTHASPLTIVAKAQTIGAAIVAVAAPSLAQSEHVEDHANAIPRAVPPRTAGDRAAATTTHPASTFSGSLALHLLLPLPGRSANPLRMEG